MNTREEVLARRAAVLTFLRTERPLRRRGHLGGHGGNCYCLLGACCEVYRRQAGQGWWDDQGQFWLPDLSYDEDPPERVCVWLGLSRHQVDALIELSDRSDVERLDGLADRVEQVNWYEDDV